MKQQEDILTQFEKNMEIFLEKVLLKNQKKKKRIKIIKKEEEYLYNKKYNIFLL